MKEKVINNFILKYITVYLIFMCGNSSLSLLNAETKLFSLWHIVLFPVAFINKLFHNYLLNAHRNKISSLIYMLRRHKLGEKYEK
jgi:hypothetical protein